MKPEEIEQRLNLAQEWVGYRFQTPEVLLEALTHRSYANETPGDPPHNDRLEFLGDAALDLVVAQIIFERFPLFDSGRMTKLRASLVNEGELAAIAMRLRLGEALLLGQGEARTGGASKASLLADTYEAVLGALYLDGGIAPLRERIEQDIGPRLEENARQPGERDYKSYLQEICAHEHLGLPNYRVTGRHGPDHETRFLVECRVSDRIVALGEGRSIKQAEQHAAHLVLDQLGRREEPA